MDAEAANNGETLITSKTVMHFPRVFAVTTKHMSKGQADITQSDTNVSFVTTGGIKTMMAHLFVAQNKNSSVTTLKLRTL